MTTPRVIERIDTQATSGMKVTLKIKGKPWTWRSVEAAFETDQIGQCDPKNLEIVVRHDIHPIQQVETTIHEIVEALNQEDSLGLDESQIERLGTGIYQVIRENPHLLQFIYEHQWPHDLRWSAERVSLERNHAEE